MASHVAGVVVPSRHPVSVALVEQVEGNRPSPRTGTDACLYSEMAKLISSSAFPSLHGKTETDIQRRFSRREIHPDFGALPVVEAEAFFSEPGDGSRVVIEAGLGDDGVVGTAVE